MAQSRENRHQKIDQASATLPFKEAIQGAPIIGEGRRGGASLSTAVPLHKLSSNENPLPPSPAVRSALLEAVGQLNRYPSIGDGELNEKIAALYGRGTTAANFVTGNGGCDILGMIATAFLSPGDEAVLCPPTFPIYEVTIKRAGALPVYAPLDEPHFDLNVERVLAAITPRTKVVYLCSPNNPTGSIIRQETFDALMAGIPPHVLVVSDEVYHHFITDPAAADSSRYLDRNVVILHSFSKVFGLAGLRLGYAIGRPEIVDYLSRTRAPYHLSQLTMVGGTAAMADRDHIEESVTMMVTERAKMNARLARLDGIRFWPSEATFFLFKTHYSGAEVQRRLAERGSQIRELKGFYMPDYLRVSLGLPEENDKFISDLKAVLGELALEAAGG